MTNPVSSRKRVGVVIPGDSLTPVPEPVETRFRRVFEELAARNVDAVPVIWANREPDTLRSKLLTMDGVLVWINPLYDGHDRAVLDAVLREVAAQRIFVSAHPDVILAMGTKDVLYRTRLLPWGTDTRIYRTAEEFAAALPVVLRAQGARVLKQHRGNDGNGVWKVELVGSEPAGDPMVEVQEAVRGANLETMPLSAFVGRCRAYFEGDGCLVDQPYQERLGDGMTRVYLSVDRVAGFGHQRVTALLRPSPGEPGPPAPPPRIYYGPDEAQFQPLRALLEESWVQQMLAVLGLTRESLPVIWDADFLLGPPGAAGNDTYVLCEINVSSVFPIPDEAFGILADATVERLYDSA